jgi:hypothetical protein
VPAGSGLCVTDTPGVGGAGGGVTANPGSQPLPRRLARVGRTGHLSSQRSLAEAMAAGSTALPAQVGTAIRVGTKPARTRRPRRVTSRSSPTSSDLDRDWQERGRCRPLSCRSLNLMPASSRHHQRRRRVIPDTLVNRGQNASVVLEDSMVTIVARAADRVSTDAGTWTKRLRQVA